MCQLGDTLLKERIKQLESLSLSSASILPTSSSLGQLLPSLSGQKQGPPSPSFLLPISLKTNSEQFACSTGSRA